MKNLTKKIKTLKTKYFLLDSRVSRLEKKTKKLILGGLAMMTFANVPYAAEICENLNWNANDCRTALEICEVVDWSVERCRSNIEVCFDLLKLDEKACLTDLREDTKLDFSHPEYSHNKYCEDVYWKDSRNCIYPEQDVTQEMCETEYFDQAQEICFKMLKEQEKK
jgi:hypothetical protein